MMVMGLVGFVGDSSSGGGGGDGIGGVCRR